MIFIEKEINRMWLQISLALCLVKDTNNEGFAIKVVLENYRKKKKDYTWYL